MDKAKKVWRGTIDFRRGLGSVGNESEYVTMLDDTVGNIAIPLLCVPKITSSGTTPPPRAAWTRTWSSTS